MLFVETNEFNFLFSLPNELYILCFFVCLFVFSYLLYLVFDFVCLSFLSGNWLPKVKFGPLSMLITAFYFIYDKNVNGVGTLGYETTKLVLHLGRVA